MSLSISPRSAELPCILGCSCDSRDPGLSVPVIVDMTTQAEGSDAAGNGVDGPALGDATGIKRAGPSVKNSGCERIRS